MYEEVRRWCAGSQGYRVMLYTYKDLVVWQKAVELAEQVYLVTESFPNTERYGLSSQMRRASVSIASNIAEGRMRGTPRYCRTFFLHAFGSAGELDTQIQIAKRLPVIQSNDFFQIESLLGEILRMLNKMIETLSNETKPTKNP